MKKIISILIIAVMMVLSLASCDIINGFLETVTEEEVRTTITREEWEAHRSIVNYTTNTSATSSYTYNNQNVSYTSTEIIQSSETAQYVKYVQLSSLGDEYILEYYEVMQNNVWYRIEKNENDGKWYAHATSYDHSASLLPEEFKFEDLTYDENKKAYVYSQTHDIEDKYEIIGSTKITYNYYFENGTLVKLILEQSKVEDNYHAESKTTAILSKIGNTKITLPEYTIQD